jgi:hypothetical protein
MFQNIAAVDFLVAQLSDLRRIVTLHHDAALDHRRLLRFGKNGRGIAASTTPSGGPTLRYSIAALRRSRQGDSSGRLDRALAKGGEGRLCESITEGYIHRDEEDWVPIFRPLDALTTLTDALSC